MHPQSFIFKFVQICMRNFHADYSSIVGKGSFMPIASFLLLQFGTYKFRGYGLDKFDIMYLESQLHKLLCLIYEHWSIMMQH